MMCFGQARRFEVGKLYWTAKGRAVVIARINADVIACHIDNSGHIDMRLHGQDGTVWAKDPQTARVLAPFTLETRAAGNAEVAAVADLPDVNAVMVDDPSHPPPLDINRQRPSAPFTHDRTDLDPPLGGRAHTITTNTDDLKSLSGFNDPDMSDTITTPATNEEGVKVRVNIGGKRGDEGAEVSQAGSRIPLLAAIEALHVALDRLQNAIGAIGILAAHSSTSSITDAGDDGRGLDFLTKSMRSPS